jgi:hypothetical protein
MKFHKIVGTILTLVMVLSIEAGCLRPSDIRMPPTTTTETAEAFQIPNNYTTYTDEASLFSVSYPNQWEPVSDLATISTQTKNAINAIKSGLPIENASILFIAGLKTMTGYIPSINIVVEPSPTGVNNNDQAVQSELLGLKQVDPNYQEVARTKALVNGKDAVIVEYKAHFSSTGQLMHNLIVVCLSGKTIWVLTCSAFDTDFSQWSSDLNNITRSFKIND